MGQDEKYQEEHSEEVEEIMGQRANWMVRWGAALLLLIVAVVVGVFFLISYPVFVTIPFQVEAASGESPGDAVFGRAVISEAMYQQVEQGQEVQVAVPDTLWQRVGRVIVGRVAEKRPNGELRLLFPVVAARQPVYWTVLQETGNAKIKIGEKRLISQFNGLFSPK